MVSSIFFTLVFFAVGCYLLYLAYKATALFREYEDRAIVVVVIFVILALAFVCFVFPFEFIWL